MGAGETLEGDQKAWMGSLGGPGEGGGEGWETKGRLKWYHVPPSPVQCQSRALTTAPHGISTPSGRLWKSLKKFKPFCWDLVDVALASKGLPSGIDDKRAFVQIVYVPCKKGAAEEPAIHQGGGGGGDARMFDEILLFG